jgi:D-amino-acid dehydrogenase
MSERANVVVIGGGVIGVCAAYFLAERGASVTLLEKGEICSGASYGNAGWVFPSHSTPIPAPGAIRSAFKWLFDRESPFYIKPRLDLEPARWLWEFRAACTAERARRAYELKRELSLASRDIFEKLAARPELGFQFSPNGLLLLFETAGGFAEAGQELDWLQALGGAGRLLARDEALELAPQASASVVGGVYYPAEAHIDPAAFVESLAREAERQGAHIVTGCEAMALELSGPRISRVVATKGDFACDEVVLAGGAWSPHLVAPLRVRLPVQSAKGYSVTSRRPEGFGDTPVMLAEAKIGVSPLGDRLRVAGTLELAGLDLSINLRRVRAIMAAAKRCLPGLGELERIETWRGLRPCTPDDLPVIGRTGRIRNLVVATGHGMSGISQGPITGQLVAELIAEQSPSMDLRPYSPDRFS